MFCGKCGSQISDDCSFCSYCGNPIVVPSQVQNQVVTVQTPSVPNNLQLSDNERRNTINNLRSFATKINELERVVDRIESNYKSLKEPRRLIVSKFKAGIYFFIPGFICLFIGVFITLFIDSLNNLATFSNLRPGWGLIWGFTLGIAFLIVGLIFSGINQKKKQAFYDEQYENDKKNYKETLLEIEELCKEKDEKIFDLENSMVGIPEQYYYTEALDFFADRLLSRRSNSLAEAMDAYDEHLHRLKLEDAAYAAAEYQKLSAEYQRISAANLASIKRASAINTAANVANFIRHL